MRLSARALRAGAGGTLSKAFEGNQCGCSYRSLESRAPLTKAVWRGVGYLEVKQTLPGTFKSSFVVVFVDTRDEYRMRIMYEGALLKS